MSTPDPQPNTTTCACAFCTISHTYAPYAPRNPPLPTSPSTRQEDRPLNPYALSPPSFILLSTPLCLAFLDIMPLAPGHLLLTTRRHAEKISEVSPQEAAEMGRWINTLSRVLAAVTGVEDWNVVQNNGAAAAQIVPHVHFHIIPRPALTAELRNRSFTMFGRGQRKELDEEEAEKLAEAFRRELAVEMRKMEGVSRIGKL